jgi:uncharacterized membrane protein YeaQ/YmgE (transglycosylase-associated protein family)
MRVRSEPNGSARKDTVMSILLFLLFGLLIGFIARALMPGKQSMGLLATGLVGVIGSLLGGVVTNLVTGSDFGRLEPAGIIGSVIGALVVLFVYGAIMRRRTGGVGRVPGRVEGGVMGDRPARTY